VGGDYYVICGCA